MFVGYSKGGKKTAYAGIHNCQNCNNITNFHLVESSFKPTVMFIPVAKFNLKYYFICSLCERGYELEKPKYDKLYRESFNLPNEEDVIPYYNLVSEELLKDDHHLIIEILDLLNNRDEDIESEKIFNLFDKSIKSNLSKDHKKYIIKQNLIHTITELASQGDK